MKTKTLIILAAAFLFGLVQPAAVSAAEVRSGITGQTFLYISYGYFNPVVVEPGVWPGIGVPGVQLPTKASFRVISMVSHRVVRRFETDAEGQFTIKLPPGSYRLVPEPIWPMGLLSQAVTTNPLRVDVLPNHLCLVNVFYYTLPFSVPFQNENEDDRTSADKNDDRSRRSKAKPNER